MSRNVQSPLFDRLLTKEFAQQLDRFSVDEPLQQRLDELASKSTEGTLTDAQKREYEEYVHSLDLITLLKAKARSFLKRHE